MFALRLGAFLLCLALVSPYVIGEQSVNMLSKALTETPCEECENHETVGEEAVLGTIGHTHPITNQTQLNGISADDFRDVTQAIASPPPEYV